MTRAKPAPGAPSKPETRTEVPIDWKGDYFKEMRKNRKLEAKLAGLQVAVEVLSIALANERLDKEDLPF